MIWSLVLAAVGVFGLWLAGRKNWIGWAVGLGAQQLWIVFAVITKQYGFIISAVAYAWVYWTNLSKWLDETRDDLKTAEHSHSNTGTAADVEIAACPICNPSL